MTQFRTRFKYGGVSTWRPGKSYSPKKQHAVLGAMFGDEHPRGPLLLPDDTPLHVGTRNTKPNYANGSAPEYSEASFALFTPGLKSKDNRQMISVSPASQCYGMGQLEVGGFLPTVLGMLLVLGRKAMEEEVTGDIKSFRPIGNSLKKKRDNLTRLMVLNALFAKAEDDTDEAWIDAFYTSMDDFLGERLAEAEVTLMDDASAGPVEAPFEKYVVDMSNRFQEILR